MQDKNRSVQAFVQACTNIIALNFINLRCDVPRRSVWSCLTSSSPRQHRTSSDIKAIGGGRRSQTSPGEGKAEEWEETEEEEEEDGCHCLYKSLLILQISKRCSPSTEYCQSDMTHHRGSLSNAKVKTGRKKEWEIDRKKEGKTERQKERIIVVKRGRGISCGFGRAWAHSSVLKRCFWYHTKKVLCAASSSLRWTQCFRREEGREHISQNNRALVSFLTVTETMLAALPDDWQIRNMWQLHKIMVNTTQIVVTRSNSNLLVTCF